MMPPPQQVQAGTAQAAAGPCHLITADICFSPCPQSGGLQAATSGCPLR
jgi:hypothetical protein